MFERCSISHFLSPNSNCQPPVSYVYVSFRSSFAQFPRPMARPGGMHGAIEFAWPLAKGVSRPAINHPHLIHKSTNRFFILSLLDLSSIPRAREGVPGGPWAPKSVGRPSDQWWGAPFGGLLATLLGPFSFLLAILGLHLLFLSFLSLPYCDF